MEHARKSNRAPVAITPRYRNAASFEYVEGRCIDLSEGGMFVAADLPAELGALIKFECAVPGKPGLMRGVARVVWRRTGAGADRPSGMGLKFVKLEPGSSEVITQLVNDAQARGTTAPEAPLQTQVRRTESVPPEEAGASSSAVVVLAGAPEVASLDVAASGAAKADAVDASGNVPAEGRPADTAQPAASATEAQPTAAPAEVHSQSAQASSGGHGASSAQGTQGSGPAIWVALAAGAGLLLWLLLR